MLASSFLAIALHLLVPQSRELVPAVALVHDRNFDEGIEALRRLCPVPAAEAARAGRRGALACELFVVATAEAKGTRTPKRAAFDYAFVAGEAAKAEEHDLAEVLYRTALDREPANVENLLSLGLLYRAMDRLSDAAEAFGAIRAIKPRDVDSLYWLATTRMDQDDFEEASRLFAEILRIDPKYARVWYRRGEMHMLQGNYALAIESFEMAIAGGHPEKDVDPKIRECERRLSGNR